MNKINNYFKILLACLILNISFSTLANGQDSTSNQIITAEYFGGDEITENNSSDDEFDNEDFEFFEEASKNKVYDPYEKVNRKIFAFNEAFDRYFFEHVAKIYRKGVPKRARRSIRNFLTNLSLPVSALNSLIQGKTDNALATMSNFIINSTVGVLGIFDVAGEKSIRYDKEDFGQTLGHYGVGSGAYLMIPILGPSSTRDFGGWLTDKAVSPTDFNALEVGGKRELIDYRYSIALTVMYGVDKRESLIEIIDDIRKDSFDPYATIRSAYLQSRENEIKN